MDIQTARQAGRPCCGVTWGYRDGGFLAEQGAACLAGSAAELCRVITEER